MTEIRGHPGELTILVVGPNNEWSDERGEVGMAITSSGIRIFHAMHLSDVNADLWDDPIPQELTALERALRQASPTLGEMDEHARKRRTGKEK